MEAYMNRTTYYWIKLYKDIIEKKKQNIYFLRFLDFVVTLYLLLCNVTE